MMAAEVSRRESRIRVPTRATFLILPQQLWMVCKKMGSQDTY
jgi:hypothetical protein